MSALAKVFHFLPHSWDTPFSSIRKDWFCLVIISSCFSVDLRLEWKKLSYVAGRSITEEEAQIEASYGIEQEFAAAAGELDVEAGLTYPGSS